MPDTLLVPSRGNQFYLTVAAIVTSCVVVTLMWIALVWIFRPGPSIIINSPPRMVSGPATSTLIYEFSYCRQWSGPIQLARELVKIDGDVLEIMPLTETLVTLEPGCHQIRMSIVTPFALAKGIYRLRLGFIDVANQRRSTTAETGEFHVE